MKSKIATMGAAVAFLALTVNGPVKAMPGAFQDVKTTYMQKCAVCHSPDGSGSSAYGKKNNLGSRFVALTMIRKDGTFAR